MTRPTLPRLAVAPLILAMLGIASPAHADDEGKIGRVHQLRINTIGSEDHSQYQGSVTLKLVPSTDLQEYRWGGSSCPGQKLNDLQIQLLMTAMVQSSKTKVSPRYTMGDRRTRCLVGFELIAG